MVEIHVFIFMRDLKYIWRASGSDMYAMDSDKKIISEQFPGIALGFDMDRCIMLQNQLNKLIIQTQP